jgi:hypothetical protein
MQTISQKISAKKPEIKVEATAKGMTVNAGLVPVLRFMDALSLDKMIPDMVSTPERATNGVTGQKQEPLLPYGIRPV